MKIRTHMNIARLAVKKTINNIEINWLEKFVFYLGTIEPDLGITQFIHPHFYVKSAEYIFLKIKKLQEKKKMGIMSAFELGRIVHYLSDFCCYVHSSGGIGNVNEHIIYERNINKYLLRNFNNFLSSLVDRPSDMPGSCNMVSIIEAAIKDYRLSKPSFFNDIEKATQICTTLLNGLYNSNVITFNNEVLSIKMKLVS